MSKQLNIQSTVQPTHRLSYNDYQLYLRRQLGIKVNVKLYKTGKL